MKYDTNSQNIATVVFLSIVAGIFVFLGTQSQQASNKVESLSESKTSSTNKQNKISDNVAYELYLRTIAEANAFDLVKRAGLSDSDVERVVSEANSLNEIFQTTDKKAREIKENQNSFSEAKKKTKLLSLQTAREEALERTVSRFLPQSLNEVAMNKLRNFINTEVKSNIQVVTAESVSKQRDSISLGSLRNELPSKKSSRGGIYLYNASWHNTTNVYGSGIVTETYTSEAGYRATVTVVSPSGRSNTTQSSWNNTIRLQSASLPIGSENGEYNVRVVFEIQDGQGKESSVIGNTISSVTVAPVVNVENVSPSTIVLGSTDTGTFTATVSLTNDVPINTVVVVEMYETSTPAFSYSVVPASREQSFTVRTGDPGTTKTVSFDVDITTTTSTGAGTSVTNKFRIQSVTAPQGQPTVTPGTNQPVGTLTYAASTPTPTPTPTPPSDECLVSSFSEESLTGKANSGLAPEPCDSTGCNGLCTQNGGFCDQGGNCVGGSPSPILIDVSGNGFDLTNAAGGVSFDIDADNIQEQVSWTATGTDDAWLALDRNANGAIDSGRELFGNFTTQPKPSDGESRNGFLALARYDESLNGGNNDGSITAQDAVFGNLRLWRDANHNGISETNELKTLGEAGLTKLELDYKESKRTDEFGNEFRYRAKVEGARKSRIERWAWDVFLVTQQP